MKRADCRPWTKVVEERPRFAEFIRSSAEAINQPNSREMDAAPKCLRVSFRGSAAWCRKVDNAWLTKIVQVNYSQKSSLKIPLRILSIVHFVNR